MAASQIIAKLPKLSYFRLPPSSEPAFLPLPQPGSLAYNPPFQISDSLYAAALDIRVPLTIAAVYAVTAKLLNKYNKSTNRRPWAISQTKAFFAFVVAHNIFLAVYSAWTWIGMVNMLRRTLANPFANTGDPSTSGWAATVDSICRMSGAPGLGNGLVYHEASGIWLTQSSPVSPEFALTPDRNQPGRMWNEGLAFYGWLFYLSKFYEVLDTFIILAKGKYSSTLQTYHHAGAMMCMWAGMRYMSAPIWMFVFMNSFIHTLMYSYFTFTAFSVRVPTKVKRSLTSAQITQFLVGASVAMSHSFIGYTVPATQAPGHDSDIVASPNSAANSTSPLAGRAAPTPLKAISCIATSSETFAIWLNVLYLAPLTYLFVKFFVTSYLARSSAESTRSAVGKGKEGVDGTIESKTRKSPAASPNVPASLVASIATTEEEVRRRLSNVGNLAEKAGWDAAIGLEKEVYGVSAEAIDTDDSHDSPVAPAQSNSHKSKTKHSK
ncbi:hypothetical protein HMPREF1624_04271 [Sporothrix schenckii ATCC 58251]|uniref:Elongation of fatty acids protein n=1 Tax=Sporothrix schenckii (strain ATCC 58251 / de Perez 2211183) TaxID=1391915 RepID=U7PVX6_SPOS1|nr:hypothetical protein HMPREF1624_04271 [Sporothrix schenckii ATCC 58251]